MADNHFERFLGICEDAESDLPNEAYHDLLYDMARTALDKARMWAPRRARRVDTSLHMADRETRPALTVRGGGA